MDLHELQQQTVEKMVEEVVGVVADTVGTLEVEGFPDEAIG